MVGPRLGVDLVALLVAVLVLAPSLSSGSKCLVQGCGTTIPGIRLLLQARRRPCWKRSTFDAVCFAGMWRHRISADDKNRALAHGKGDIALGR